MNNGGIIYELPIAQVRIIKGKSFIDGTQITDERTFCDLQGQTGLYAKKNSAIGRFLVLGMAGHQRGKTGWFRTS